jgi:hypothetical protein
MARDTTRRRAAVLIDALVMQDEVMSIAEAESPSLDAALNVDITVIVRTTVVFAIDIRDAFGNPVVCGAWRRAVCRLVGVSCSVPHRVTVAVATLADGRGTAVCGRRGLHAVRLLDRPC